MPPKNYVAKTSRLCKMCNMHIYVVEVKEEIVNKYYAVYQIYINGANQHAQYLRTRVPTLKLAETYVKDAIRTKGGRYKIETEYEEL